MTTYIGIDPDTHHTGIAFVENGKVTRVDCVRIPTTIKGERAVVSMAAMLSGYAVPPTTPAPDSVVVVEGQMVTFRTRNPQNIIWLAQVAGAAVAAFAPYSRCVLLPEPKAWKGQVPKRIHQKRIYDRLGWPCMKHGKDDKTGYCSPIEVPPRFQGICPTHWKHIGDAIGLALWAHRQDVIAGKLPRTPLRSSP